jgi:hypothetical protein
MKKILWLITIVFFGETACNAQQSVLPFFQKLFVDLKTSDSVDFGTNSLNGQQFERLVRISSPQLADTSEGWIRVKRFADLFYHQAIIQRFGRLMYQADSLGIDLTKSDYVDCKLEEIKDPMSYFRSARGIIYFKSKGSDYEWIVSEAIWIDDDWKLLTTGKIVKGSAVGFPPAKADAISSFGSSSKIKVTKVVLTPPPPDVQKPPPPPPPEPPKTKH